MLAATEVELIDGLQAQTLSGRGRLDPAALGDGVRYDHAHAHCDVLVVGAGPAALAAADAASAGGARVILVDDGPRLGGGLLDAGPAEAIVDGLAPLDWVAGVEARLPRAPRSGSSAARPPSGCTTRAMRSSRSDAPPASGCGTCAPAASCSRPAPTSGRSCSPTTTGRASCSPSAARTYVHRYAVAPGRRAVVFTTNDSAYAPPPLWPLRASRSPHRRCAAPAIAGRRRAARDRRRRRSTRWSRRSASRVSKRCASRRSTATARSARSLRRAARLGRLDAGVRSCSATPAAACATTRVACVPSAGRTATGACAASARAAGCSDLAEALADGWARGREAATAVGRPAPQDASAPVTEPPPATAPPRALWLVPSPDGRWDTPLRRPAARRDRRRHRSARSAPACARSSTSSATRRSAPAPTRAGRRACSAVGVVATLLGVGLDGSWPRRRPGRPPRPVRSRCSPAATAATCTTRCASRRSTSGTSRQARSSRTSASGSDRGTTRATARTCDAAVARECRAAREGVGDDGRLDARQDRRARPGRRRSSSTACTPTPSPSSPSGPCRYGVLCRADGMVFDDGVVDAPGRRPLPGHDHDRQRRRGPRLARGVAADRVARAARALHVGDRAVVDGGRSSGRAPATCCASLAPDLDARQRVASVHDARARRRSRGIPARVCRVSFSGELAYEVNVAGRHGTALWDAVMAAGARVRHHAVRHRGDARAARREGLHHRRPGHRRHGHAASISGYGWLVSKRKGDFVGRRSLRAPGHRARGPQAARRAAARPGRVLPRARSSCSTPRTPAGARWPATSRRATDSAALERTFALALVRGGRARIGETVHVSHDGGWVAATVAEPVVYDPEGARRDGDPASD